MKKIYFFSAICILCIFGLDDKCIANSSKPIAFYPFSGNANDQSENGLNGVVYGATPVADRHGNQGEAYSFDGINDFIDIPGTNSLHLTTGFSICAWINFTESTSLKSIIAKHISGYGNGFIMHIREFVTPEFFISSEPGLRSSEPLNDGKWHFLAGTYNGSEMKLFVDGVLKGSMNKTYSNTNDSTIQIGRHHAGAAANFFNGKIDDVFIFDRAISESEVSAIFSENNITASISIISPNGGESIFSGSSQDITWISSNVENVKIEFSADNGTNWDVVVSSFPASSGKYSVNVPKATSTECLIRISDASNAAIADISNSTFTVIEDINNVSDEKEPNNSHTSSGEAELGSVLTGEIGYSVDVEDWYKINISVPGKYMVIENTSSYLWSGMNIYNNGLENLGTSEAIKGIADTLFFDCKTIGEYYIKIYNWGSGFGKYSFKVEFVSDFEHTEAVAWYPFNGNANDESGKGWDATFVSATSVSDRFGNAGKAFYFNGNGDHIKLPNIIKNSFSVNFWVKTSFQGLWASQWHGGNGLVDAEVPGAANDWGTSLIDGGKVAFGFGPNDITIKSTKLINDGKWHMVTATRNILDGSFSLYINGLFENSGQAGTNELNSPEFIGVGNDAGGVMFNVRWFEGVIDDILFFDRVIPNDEMQLLFGKGGYTYIDENETREFRIIPNPAKGTIKILSNNIEKILKLDVIDNIGKLRYSVEDISNGELIDLNLIGKGLYMVRLTYNDKTKVQKLIIE